MSGLQHRASAKISQFSGSYLNTAWTRRFILGSLLQRYDPPAKDIPISSDPSTLSPSSASAALEGSLLRLQRLLSESWALPVRPLDATSESRILRLLARFASGEATLSTEALAALNGVLERIPDAPTGLEDPRQMEALLRHVRYVAPGDNLHRVAYGGELHFPPSALGLMEPFLHEDLARDGGDAFDALRDWVDGPAYAIDSATTSEVDDAIGVHVDAETGEEYFVVYVSDATVHCPFDSSLEQVTARLLTTTTYLPEGVYFMLPKPIVEAATLREDRPCRTFNIRFQIDERTGELKRYSVHVGWLRQLRRITYDDVQALYDGAADDSPHAAGGEKKHKSERETLPGPSWMTDADASRLRRIHSASVLRQSARQRLAQDHFIDSNLPDPLIKVQGTNVVSVEDQIISTRDARLAVAEMMIAANEVCSRIAQVNGIPIPYRGTRELSTDHEAARVYVEPRGVTVMPSLDTQYIYFAQAIHHAIRQLSGVTRAVYFHTPIHHAGLDTHHYTHSTSPLRRYADMLVHHQLKVWLWRTASTMGAKTKSMKKHDSNRKSLTRAIVEQPIAEHTMATLCSMISLKQEQSSLLQDSSQRYWLLRYIEQNLLAINPRRRLVCLVGETKNIEAAPEYTRFLPEAQPSMSVGNSMQGLSTVPFTGRWQQQHHEYQYVSDIYIPELQFAHVVYHSMPGVVIGAVVECEVRCVQPTQGYLVLTIVRVWPGGDERRFESLWRKAVLPSLDS